MEDDLYWNTESVGYLLQFAHVTKKPFTLVGNRIKQAIANLLLHNKSVAYEHVQIAAQSRMRQVRLVDYVCFLYPAASLLYGVQYVSIYLEFCPPQSIDGFTLNVNTRRTKNALSRATCAHA